MNGTSTMHGIATAASCIALNRSVEAGPYSPICTRSHREHDALTSVSASPKPMRRAPVEQEEADDRNADRDDGDGATVADGRRRLDHGVNDDEAGR